MTQLVNKLAVIGVGLIGGSFALAMKRAKAVGRVIGVGRTDVKSQSLAIALELGVIDEIGAIDRATLYDADLVLLAMPVGQMAATMHAIAPHLGARTVVTDAGSTKQDVVAAARKRLAGHLAQFVPAHPIAGAELSGPAAAKADLFDGKRVVIAMMDETSAESKALVEAAWSACGAKLSGMSAQNHDAVFATVSHLPHLLAYALVHEVCERGNAEQLFGYAAGGFRDFTRIAGSDVRMWSDIFFGNRVALLEEIDAYVDKLEMLRGLLVAGDTPVLEEILQRARDSRNKWALAQTSGAAPGK